MSDPFEEYARKSAEESKRPFKDALLFAHSEAHTDSGRAFVKSCQDFFNAKGYLTEKQVNALYKVDTEPTYRGRNYDDHYDADDYEGGLTESDFAGGDPSW